MNMEELYEEMKEALRYFGLGFHEKDKVDVIVGGTKVCFRHDNRIITIETAK